jgi:cytochrome P450
MVYGIRQQGQSELFDAVSNAQDEFLRNNTPGMWLIDGYPQLGNLPKFLQWWRPYGEKVYNQTRDAFRAYYDLMLDNIAKGVQKDCFATKFYSEADSKYPQFDFDQRLFTTGGIVEAGSDTSKNQLNMLFAAMAKNDDDWVAKARNELDQVCGNNAERLPQFSDWEHLPYLQAIIKETMRWRPNVSPTGFPHALMQDDEYEGYKFPAGTVFTINNWALSLSSKEYEEPEKFKPERFMNKDLFNPLKGHYGYGAGNVSCFHADLKVVAHVLGIKSPTTRCSSSSVG